MAPGDTRMPLSINKDKSHKLGIESKRIKSHIRSCESSQRSL